MGVRVPVTHCSVTTSWEGHRGDVGGGGGCGATQALSSPPLLQQSKLAARLLATLAVDEPLEPLPSRARHPYTLPRPAAARAEQGVATAVATHSPRASPAAPGVALPAFSEGSAVGGLLILARRSWMRLCCSL